MSGLPKAPSVTSAQPILPEIGARISVYCSSSCAVLKSAALVRHRHWPAPVARRRFRSSPGWQRRPAAIASADPLSAWQASERPVPHPALPVGGQFGAEWSRVDEIENIALANRRALFENPLEDQAGNAGADIVRNHGRHPAGKLDDYRQYLRLHIDDGDFSWRELWSAVRPSTPRSRSRIRKRAEILPSSTNTESIHPSLFHAAVHRKRSTVAKPAAAAWRPSTGARKNRICPHRRADAAPLEAGL